MQAEVDVSKTYGIPVGLALLSFVLLLLLVKRNTMVAEDN